MIFFPYLNDLWLFFRKLAKATATLDAEVVDGSILGQMLAKSDVTAFDRTTDSLEGIADKVEGLKRFRKGVACTIAFPIYDSDGDLVVGAAGLDSEVSKDGGTFADCTNEASQIATNSGMYTIALTADEMTADVVAVITKTSTSGAKTAVNVIYTTA